MSRRKLLLADDSVTIQKVVNLTFADEGIEVFAVGDGNEAVDRLLEISPDLVMADVNMPGISGYRVCERIKQQEKFRNTPVILLVGSFEPFDEEEARRVGADDYLTKPFQSIRQLVSKVTDLLERSTAENAEAAPPENSFAETQEMPLVEAEIAGREPEAPRYDDAGFDDEMIQTSPATSFAYDEAQKFSVANYVEPHEEDYGGKTQPLSADDLREIQSAQTAAPEDGYVSAPPQQEDSTAAQQTYQSEISQPPQPQAQTAQAFDSGDDDDDDFLELFDDDEFEDDEEEEETAAEYVQPQAQIAGEASAESGAAFSETENYQAATAAAENVQTPESFVVQPLEAEAVETVEAQIVQPAETPGADAAQPAAESAQIAEAPETVRTGETAATGNAQTAEDVQSSEATAASQPQFSPELIDAIAQRVIEKLSENAVKEIAWEVVPQQADLIIKKMVEEKLKE